MKYLISFFVINILFINILNANNTAVVDTDILLVKKYAKDDSKKLSFYKMNDLIKIISEEKDKEGTLWYKTEKGYVKAEFVIKEDNLPIFLNNNEVDTSKNAIQLIVFNLKAKKALLQLKKILKNEKNIFVQKTSKAQVVYLVNFKNYKSAKQKQKEISKYYKTSFITKIRNLKYKNNIKTKNVISKINKQEVITKPKTIKQDYNEFKDMDINIEDEIGSIDIDKQMAEFDDINTDENNIDFKTNNKPIYTVNKVKTLNFAKNNKENDIIKEKKIIKKELEDIEELKVTKIAKKTKKEEVKIIKPVKQKAFKKETKVEKSFYNNVEPKKHKTTSRFNLRVFDHSKKVNNNKPKTFKNNYFKDEVKKVGLVLEEKSKPKIQEDIKEEVIIKKVISVKKIDVIKPNLTDKIEHLLLGL